VKDHTIRELRDGIACPNDINEDRLAADNAGQGFAIGLIDALHGLASRRPSALQLGKKIGKASIAARRRAPAHMNDFGALPRKVLGKQLEANIDDARRRRQQSIRLDTVLGFVRAHHLYVQIYTSNPHLAAAAKR
jgi:hypothetical protein